LQEALGGDAKLNARVGEFDAHEDRVDEVVVDHGRRGFFNQPFGLFVATLRVEAFSEEKGQRRPVVLILR
jgi:hypothetical protein